MGLLGAPKQACSVGPVSAARPGTFSNSYYSSWKPMLPGDSYLSDRRILKDIRKKAIPYQRVSAGVKQDLGCTQGFTFLMGESY